MYTAVPYRQEFLKPLNGYGYGHTRNRLTARGIWPYMYGKVLVPIDGDQDQCSAWIRYSYYCDYTRAHNHKSISKPCPSPGYEKREMRRGDRRTRANQTRHNFRPPHGRCAIGCVGIYGGIYFLSIHETRLRLGGSEKNSCPYITLKSIIVDRLRCTMLSP